MNKLNKFLHLRKIWIQCIKNGNEDDFIQSKYNEEIQKLMKELNIEGFDKNNIWYEKKDL